MEVQAIDTCIHPERKFVKHTIRFAAIPAAIIATPTIANESTDLAVTGSFVPSACQVSLSDGGRMNFGNVSMETFNETGYTAVGTRQVTLNLTCTSAAPVAVAIADNRASSIIPGLVADRVAGRTDADAFGLGTDGTVNVGTYTLTMGALSANGANAGAISSIDNGASWVASAGATHYMGPSRIYTAATAETTTPLPVTSLTSQIEATVYANTLEALPTNRRVDMDGSATPSIVYL